MNNQNYELYYDNLNQAQTIVDNTHPETGIYEPKLKTALFHCKEAVKYAQLYDLESHCDESIIDNTFWFDGIIYSLMSYNFDDCIVEYPPEKEYEIEKANLDYYKDIVEIITYISKVYEKYFHGTEDEYYVKHCLIYEIVCLCQNNFVFFNSSHYEFIGLPEKEKEGYLKLYDTLLSEGIQNMNFNRFMYFHGDPSIDRTSVEKYAEKENEWLKANTTNNMSSTIFTIFGLMIGLLFIIVLISLII